MKTWYSVVCDEHKEFVRLFNSNRLWSTAAYLSEHEEAIRLWLERHQLCKLRLIHKDEELDEVNNAGYELVKP